LTLDIVLRDESKQGSIASADATVQLDFLVVITAIVTSHFSPPEK
jgi:hypothetical protein